ncbi:lipopolysaccharide heptosyltransferase II [Nitrospina watsonii]|uniref:lipopolysaccharide heptosyltransferase II n=1 Tax=Nitrospina watsonii TaxID=1323948 RepID=A0ABM9HHA3_9BACT|nr:lipopolysaccharide heptosyltransferase II [Nitrospina watsonii]CAI2719405.1 ADP-heptose--lipooligosaccharide heptosyltransferase II [Nitrospina watsonii]
MRSTDWPNQSIHHIALWMPNWLGDVVFALPAVQAVKKRFPDARFTAIVRRPADEFLKHHPAFDSVVRIPYTASDSALAALRFACALRKYHFDLSILFPNAIRAAILSRISGSRFRVGYNTESRGLLLTHAVPATDSRRMHAVDYYYRLAEPLGVEPLSASPLERRFDAVLTEEDVARQKALLDARGLDNTPCLVAVQPGASKPEKRWHAERFGELCRRLVVDQDARIVFLGSKAEAGLIEDVRRFCPPESSVALTGLNMHDVLAVMKNCRFLLANDSGIMNLAAMVGTPVVAIFGPGNVLTTDPVIASEKKEVVTKNFPCSPCRHRFFEECEPSANNKPYCLEDISVDEVMAAVQRLLTRV